MKSPTGGFPTIPQAALLLLANFFLNLAVAMVLYGFRQLLDLSETQLNALASLLGSGLLLALIVHYRKMTYGDLLHPSSASVLATTALLVPAVLLLAPMLLLADTGLMDLMETLWPLSQWEQRLFDLMADGSFSNVFWICVLAPVLEEMLFRGILLRGFLQRYPRGPAIAISALFFGVAHLNIYQFVLAFLLGLLLGWLYERSRSLIPCIALHAAMNAGATMVAQSVPQAAEFQLSDVPLWAWGLAVAAAIPATLFLLRTLGSRSAPAS